MKTETSTQTTAIELSHGALALVQPILAVAPRADNALIDRCYEAGLTRDNVFHVTELVEIYTEKAYYHSLDGRSFRYSSPEKALTEMVKRLEAGIPLERLGRCYYVRENYGFARSIGHINRILEALNVQEENEDALLEAMIDLLDSHEYSDGRIRRFLSELAKEDPTLAYHFAAGNVDIDFIAEIEEEVGELDDESL